MIRKPAPRNQGGMPYDDGGMDTTHLNAVEPPRNTATSVSEEAGVMLVEMLEHLPYGDGGTPDIAGQPGNVGMPRKVLVEVRTNMVNTRTSPEAPTARKEQAFVPYTD